MTTLVVGCGYLGRRVAARLVERGERVLGTTRSEARARELAGLGIEPVVADVLEPVSWQHLPAADRTLFAVGFDRAAGAPMRTVYVEGLRHVLERLAGQVVYASSTGVYGQTDGGWVNERSATEPRHESGRVVLEAERVLRQAAADRPIEPIIVRFAGLYGPGRVVRRALLERGEAIPGDPEKFLNLIHIDDAAGAVIAAFERGRSDQVYLAADDRPVTRREYYARVAECLSVRPPRFLPPSPGSAEAERDATNKRVSNRRLRDELNVNLAYPDITTGLPAALAEG